MGQPGRQYSAGTGYRYGFNGKENDNEIKGEGNQQDYGIRIYDTRLGRFLSVDPLTRGYPMLTPYQFASNTPILGVDLDGMEFLSVNSAIYLHKYLGTQTTVKLFTNEKITHDIYGVQTVYHNIPSLLQDEENKDLKFTRGGPVTPDGKDLDLSVGQYIVKAGRYHNPGPEFYGDATEKRSPSSTASTQGTYSFSPDQLNNSSTGANTAASSRVSSGANVFIEAFGIISNIKNQKIWEASTKEQKHRQAFYDATNWANAFIDAGKLINFPSLATGKGKSDLINFFVDGTLPMGNAKIGDLTLSQLTNNLEVFKVGIHFLDYMKTRGEKVEVGKSLTNTLSELISAYQRAGGNNSYEDVKKQLK